MEGWKKEFSIGMGLEISMTALEAGFKPEMLCFAVDMDISESSSTIKLEKLIWPQKLKRKKTERKK